MIKIRMINQDALYWMNGFQKNKNTCDPHNGIILKGTAGPTHMDEGENRSLRVVLQSSRESGATHTKIMKVSLSKG